MEKFVAVEKEIKVEGVTLINVQGVVDMGTAMDQAFFTEGEILVYHPNFAIAQEKAEALNNELEFEVSQIVEGMQDGRVTVSKLIEDGMADDVVAYVQAEAKKGTVQPTNIIKEEKEMENKHLEMVMGNFGLKVGQHLELSAGPDGGFYSVQIKGFTTTDEGGMVVLSTSNGESTVHLNTVLEAKKEMETRAKKEAQIATRQQNNVKVEKTMTQEEIVANSDSANAFLNAIKKNNAAGQKEENTKEEVKMNNSATRQLKPAGAAKSEETAVQTKVENKEEKEMNKGMGGRRVGRVGVGAAGNTAGAGRVSRVLGDVPTVARGVVAGVTNPENIKEIVFNSSEERKSGVTVRSELKAWYLEDRFNGVVITDESIVSSPKNADLGIDELRIFDPAALYAEGKIKFEDESALAYVELEMANGNIIVPFKIRATKNEKNPAPIESSNIKRAKNTFTGEWKSEYAFYVKNDTEYRVKCSCGAINTIKEVGTEQKCYKDECKKTIGVLPAEAVGGDMSNSSYVQKTLPFGFEFSEAILAQVMAFAHNVLAPLFVDRNQQ